MLPRSGRTAVVALVATALAACTGPQSRPGGPPPGELRPASASGSWQLGGSSGTETFRPLPIKTGWGPTAAEIDRARTLVGRLSLRERAGQVIVASYDGTGAPTELVNRLHLGGVIPFSANVVSADQIRRTNRTLQASVARAGRRWPLMIGVDQEGGRVARVVNGATAFPPLMAAGAAGDRRLTRSTYAASGAELVGMGFNVDFAPDADVTVGDTDPAIGERSAGSVPGQVGGQVGEAMRGFMEGGVVPVLKHFPGHGSVTTDSHVGLPVQRKSLRALRGSDLVPFRDGIAAGAPAVMVGHLDVRAVDPRMPSSLSGKVVDGLLRGRMGFRGVAFTDSLEMAAVADRFGSAGAAVHALRAGEDVVLMPPDPRAARDGIVAAVRDGRLDQARLDQAATRMVALLLHQRAAGKSGRPAGSSGAVSQRLSAAALTSVSGPCSGRLVGTRVRATGPDSAVARFTSAAKSAGLVVTRKKATTVRLVTSTAARPRGDVVVALDRPWVLGRSTAAIAKLATYGDSSGAMTALVDVLLGRAPARGTLPVDVPGLPRRGCAR